MSEEPEASTRTDPARQLLALTSVPSSLALGSEPSFSPFRWNIAVTQFAEAK